MSAAHDSPEKSLIFVPGLPHARRERAQHLVFEGFAAGWRARGYSVQVHQFCWYHEDQSLEEAAGRLGDAIEEKSVPVHLIGASAGGLAVINALGQHPDKVAGVLTIASPIRIPQEEAQNYWGQTPHIPPLMHEAYVQADEFMNGARADLRKIVSVYGVDDDQVPPAWSQRPGIESYQLPRRAHGSVILGAFTLHSYDIERLI